MREGTGMPDRIWGGLSGRQWAGPVPGAGHCAALPVLSAGKALPVGRPRHASDAFFLRVRFSGGQRALPRSPAAWGRSRKRAGRCRGAGTSYWRRYDTDLFGPDLPASDRVTRTADDFYAAFDRDILIKTKFCSVRAFQEKALLRSDLFGELVFTALFAPMPESLKHYRPQHRHFLLDESRVSGDKLDKILILSEFPQGRWFNGHQYAV